MTIANKGNIVQVHYTGRLTDGKVFDSSEGRDPLEFTVGAGQMIAGFDSAVEGMTLGETKKIEIEPADAYGEYREDLIKEISNEYLPAGIELEVGMQLQGMSEDGYPMLLTVKEVREDSIVVDANHDLAGKTLVFDITLVNVFEE